MNDMQSHSHTPTHANIYAIDDVHAIVAHDIVANRHAIVAHAKLNMRS